MSKISTKILSFPASTSPDVIKYHLYIAEYPTVVDYDSEVYDLGNTTSVDLKQILSSKEGIFNIGITAVDDNYNESDMTLLDNVPLDFMPPNPPGALSIT